MNALILAAGFGTRLLPYTRTLPKPLFTLSGKPILQHTIERLIQNGCRRILINTHHLSHQITDFLDHLNVQPDVDIQEVYEPLILDTGGAIANVRDVMRTDSFFVINSDVVTDIDLSSVWRFHLTHQALATLVLHDRAAYNQVTMDSDAWITGFRTPGQGLAFTGIQVLSPKIFDHLPENRVFSSIAWYAQLCPAKKIKAYVAPNLFWEEIGTVDAYSRTARLWISARALGSSVRHVDIHALSGDGSDRSWFRAKSNSNLPSLGSAPGSVVVCDHGICLPETDRRAQVDAFVSIGNHLYQNGICVPQILAYDAFSGVVAVQDLGNLHLADVVVAQMPNLSQITGLYEQVIDQLILFSRKGAQGFDLSWTCQTPYYSRTLILENECQYFVERFVQGYLGKHIDFNALADDFYFIADQALTGGENGLMHRDCQSKNIMIKNGAPFFIDFQAARIGPLQYDLASLLLDPYVALPKSVQKNLLVYAMDRLNLISPDRRQQFRHNFDYCSLTRNLQILGAFAYLSRIKGKLWFETYIPTAVASLTHWMRTQAPDAVRRLKKLILSL
ncbi:MAG: phosphotransferase [Desulfotignum sp.]|nr:phosphotransferase [Desulfotignum sp.]MCF8136711.1 phosphotransferase [Desulfotignum sp.]